MFGSFTHFNGDQGILKTGADMTPLHLKNIAKTEDTEMEYCQQKTDKALTSDAYDSSESAVPRAEATWRLTPYTITMQPQTLTCF